MASSSGGSSSSSSSLPKETDDQIPTNCITCDKEISRQCPAMIQQCACLIALCHDCALRQLINRVDTYRSYIECPLCLGHTKADSGVFHDVDKVKEIEWNLLLRAMDFFGLTRPSSSRRNPAVFTQLVHRFSEHGFFQSPTAAPSSSSSPIMTSSRLLQEDVTIQQLHLARLEWMRGGPLFTDSADDPWNNDPTLQEEEAIDREKGEISLGPLRYLYFSRNLALERLLCLDSGESEEIDLICNVCSDTLKPGSSVLTSCECSLIFCQRCGVKSALTCEFTYTAGLKCPMCRRFSKIAFKNIDEVERVEEDMFIQAYRVTQHHNPNGAARRLKALRKDSQRDNAALQIFNYYWEHSLTPKSYFLDSQHMSSLQLRLEACRLEDYRVRRHEKGEVVEGESDGALPEGPLKRLQCNVNPYLEVYIRHTTLTPEEDLFKDIDWSQFRFDPAKAAASLLGASNSSASNSSASASKVSASHSDSVEVECGDNDSNRFVKMKRSNMLICPMYNTALQCTCRFYTSNHLQLHMKLVHKVKGHTMASNVSSNKGKIGGDDIVWIEDDSNVMGNSSGIEGFTAMGLPKIIKTTNNSNNNSSNVTSNVIVSTNTTNSNNNNRGSNINTNTNNNNNIVIDLTTTTIISDTTNVTSNKITNTNITTNITNTTTSNSNNSGLIPKRIIPTTSNTNNNVTSNNNVSSNNNNVSSGISRSIITTTIIPNTNTITTSTNIVKPSTTSTSTTKMTVAESLNRAFTSTTSPLIISPNTISTTVTSNTLSTTIRPSTASIIANARANTMLSRHSNTVYMSNNSTNNVTSNKIVDDDDLASIEGDDSNNTGIDVLPSEPSPNPSVKVSML